MGQYPGAPLGFARAVRQAAYERLPLPPERKRPSTIHPRGPRSGGWKACLPNTQLVGCATAVLQYTCLSRFISALATRLLGAPIRGFSPEFGLVTTAPLAEEALRAFTEPDGIVGFELKLSKSEWGQILGFLGLLPELCPAACRPCVLPNLRKISTELKISKSYK